MMRMKNRTKKIRKMLIKRINKRLKPKALSRKRINSKTLTSLKEASKMRVRLGGNPMR